MDERQIGARGHELGGEPQRLARRRAVAEAVAVAHDAGEECGRQLGVELHSEVREHLGDDLAGRCRGRIDQVQLGVARVRDVMVNVDEARLGQPCGVLDRHPPDALERRRVADHGQIRRAARLGRDRSHLGHEVVARCRGGPC